MEPNEKHDIYEEIEREYAERYPHTIDSLDIVHDEVDLPLTDEDNEDWDAWQARYNMGNE